MSHDDALDSYVVPGSVPAICLGSVSWDAARYRRALERISTFSPTTLAGSYARYVLGGGDPDLWETPA